MTDGQKRYWMLKSMETYYREIENSNRRFEGLLIQVKEAVEKKDISTVMKIEKKIRSLRDEMKTKYEELEVIRKEYIRLYGEPAL